MTTNRTDFNETWLTEMPRALGTFPMYDTINYSIKDRIKSGSPVIDLGNSLKKIQGQQVVYYWYEKDGNILLGAELNIRPQGLVVSALGKLPDFSGPPYASDLYDAILNDSNRSIKLISDIDLSEDAFKLWSRLVDMGHSVSVFDRTNPGQSFTTIKNADDLNTYFGQGNPDFRKYQYVLSESTEMLAEVRSYFNTRRMRELAGIGLED